MTVVNRVVRKRGVSHALNLKSDVLQGDKLGQVNKQPLNLETHLLTNLRKRTGAM